ncbi:DUF4446 family protein [Nocardioides sp. HDW12B]|uniref:DUF4446 family protein n=1 Tax=Nocardioides sp. HDW12B TaxID=2714939 RepID=UPI00140808D6|nr:DUF4446 family protein [Nocardioides sp. HDW12B]QIK68070.1 DUF4446 family protein [Nocardioides sp. HDW12B]
MSNSSLTVLVVLVGLVSLLGLVIALSTQRSLTARKRGARSSPLPLDLAGLRGEVETLRQEAAGAVRRIGLVRYDAFGDMGGRLSWSLALLDDSGEGVVLTSIHGRSEARTYAKNINAWTSDQQLSPEEQDAVTGARGDAAS